METTPDIRAVRTLELGRNGSSSAEPLVSSEPASRRIEIRHRGRSPVLLATLGVVAGVGAMALGAAALFTAHGKDTPAAVPADERRALALLAKPSTERIAFRGSSGTLTLAVGSGGKAAVLMRSLPPAAEGETYHAWVFVPGSAPQHAAAFEGTERVAFLSAPVEPGDTVGIVLAGLEASAPAGSPEIVAERPY